MWVVRGSRGCSVRQTADVHFVEAAKREGLPVDLHAAHMAAQALCRREDQMVFYGVKRLGIEGLLTTGGTNVLDRGDWSADESSFTDIDICICCG